MEMGPPSLTSRSITPSFRAEAPEFVGPLSACTRMFRPQSAITYQFLGYSEVVIWRHRTMTTEASVYDAGTYRRSAPPCTRSARIVATGCGSRRAGQTSRTINVRLVQCSRCAITHALVCSASVRTGFGSRCRRDQRHKRNNCHHGVVWEVLELSRHARQDEAPYP